MPHLKPAPHVSTMTQPAFACSGFPQRGAVRRSGIWHVSTVSDLAFHIRRHFDDLEITHAPYEPEYLPLLQLPEGHCGTRQGREHSAELGRRHDEKHSGRNAIIR